ncbi:CinA family nicotinamide mononucleotide deamidase-related protein [Chryseobacterium sp. A301]
MKAVIIAVGGEILSGDTLDTNSNFIATELKKIGVALEAILTVKDELAEIVSALGRAFERADLVLTTGGLGPTKDDQTLLAFGRYFGVSSAIDPATYEHLKSILEKRNRSYLLDLNKNQALVLEGAKVFQNEHGTAPCQMMEKEGKIAICMPGVPYEVKPLVKDQIIPYLSSRFSLPFLVTRTVSVSGIPESELSNLIEEWELSLPKHLSLSYLPVEGRIKLQLSGSGNNLELLKKELTDTFEPIRSLLAPFVFSWDGSSIEAVLHTLLQKEKLTLSVAESCTGGTISSCLVSVPGISAHYLGGIVPYDTSQKVKLLGVREKTIQEFGVVSSEVAKEMSLCCQKFFGSELAIATTGAAGPSSDAYNTPVGEVYYSIRVHDFEVTRRLYLPHLDRKDFMNFVSLRALHELAEILVKRRMDWLA